MCRYVCVQISTRWKPSIKLNGLFCIYIEILKKVIKITFGKQKPHPLLLKRM